MLPLLRAGLPLEYVRELLRSRTADLDDWLAVVEAEEQERRFEDMIDGSVSATFTYKASVGRELRDSRRKRADALLFRRAIKAQQTSEAQQEANLRALFGASADGL